MLFYFFLYVLIRLANPLCCGFSSAASMSWRRLCFSFLIFYIIEDNRDPSTEVNLAGCGLISTNLFAKFHLISRWFVWPSRSWYKNANNGWLWALYRTKKKDRDVKTCFLTASEKYYKENRTKEYDSIDRDLFIPKPIPTKELVEKLNKSLTDKE